MINAMAAARVLCEARDWKISNLELQKLLYIAHMFHIGLRNAPLVDGHFEAWDYGPVHPEVYHRAKVFGDSHVKDVFHGASLKDSQPEKKLLIKTATELSGRSPGNLVAVTHWEKGAWHKNYKAGERGSVIPKAHILSEYNERARNRETAPA